jgi:3-hydroxymyristoyl/3-hydroxydecanoyl-(acyl carrier protein) dehydratase
METVKFQELIRPGREVFMELTLQPERSRFVFRLHDGDTAFSSGRMVFDALQEPI